MALGFQESHFEDNSPPTSTHGGRGGSGEATSNAPLRQSEDASSGDQVREKGAAATTLTKRQKVRHHCGRFWYWYLLGTVILLAILLPILFLVILPAIVQRIVSEQPLPVTGGSFIALSPSVLSVSITTSLDTPLPADLDPTTLFLYNKNTTEFSPFLNITLPPQHVDGETEIVVTDQIVEITNEPELVKWFNNVFDQPSSELSTRGDTTVHLGKLHSNAHIDKTIQISSLNQLSGFGIENLQLMVPPQENGTNVQGTLNLPNHGALTLGLGNIMLNLMAGDLRIGLITLYDVTIPPGNNSRYFNGELFLGTLVKNFGQILASQADAISSGNIQIDATGNATLVDGQHIKFVEAILNDKRVTSMLPVTKLLGDLVSSFTGSGEASVTDLFGAVFGNSTLIDDILSHWNTTGTGGDETAAKMKKSLRSVPRDVSASAAMSLLKLGMRMAKH